MELIMDLDVNVYDDNDFNEVFSSLEGDDHPLYSVKYDEELKDSDQELFVVRKEFEEVASAELKLKQKLEKTAAQFDNLKEDHRQLEQEISKRESFINESGSHDFKSNMNDLDAVDIERKLLNAYKRLLKFKWLRNNKNCLEALIFNDITAYLQHLDLQNQETNADNLWCSVNLASDKSWIQ